MERLKMHSVNKVDENIKKIAELFPNTLTEVIKGYRDDGTPIIEHAIDFDMLRQELSDIIVEGPEERYQFTWPDKKKSILLANAPIAKTLRPCREESVGFDTTENLYIEGDNLDALKLLQETYLGKVKMIYIDPPYNTGKDFIYEDDFAQSMDEYLENSGQFDEDGNRLVQNTESNGRFHTDWLNMMYPRLKLAKDLLSDDGVIFISIDDNEVENLKKICNEIFGEKNFIGEIIRKTKSMTGDNGNGFNLQHENLMIYAKNKMNVYLFGKEKEFENYSNPDNDPNGDWCAGDPSAKSGGDSTYFPIVNPYTNKVDYPPKGRYWAFSQSTLKNYIERGKIKFKEDHKENERGFIFKRYKNEAMNPYNPVNSLFAIDNEFMNQSATTELKELFTEAVFSYPKPTFYLYELIKCSATDDSDIILDFFSGSATTAHAVMKLNAEDGGNRKFIMVQLPEETAENSEAYKAGYKTIAEIGKERIRRAGKKILKEHPEAAGKLDIGFRVLKVDSTNMQDVYYRPDEYTQDLLTSLTDNIKPDRTPEDLLFQVMLDLGVLLSSKIEETVIGGKKVFNVADGYLMACFDNEVTDEVVREIAKKQPYYAVFRDSGMASDSVATNFEQIFETYSPSTVRKVL
jgi:adenine-specific DNA-methyltransferase